MTRIVFAGLMVLVQLSFLVAKPNRPPIEPEKKKEVKLPVIYKPFYGPSNWGVVRYTDETSICLRGHNSWEADGTVDQRTGKVFITWTSLFDGRVGVSSYMVKENGEMEGCWGWINECNFTADGELIGETRKDRILKIEQ